MTRRTPQHAEHSGSNAARRVVLTWPLPALAAWGACWALFLALYALAVPPGWSASLAAILGIVLGMKARSAWRRGIIAAGFPLSLAASGLGAGLPAWAWLLPLGLLAVLYPVNAWRDAPLFPTPKGCLDGLEKIAPLHPAARILDAGCGLRNGLAELRRVYPHAELEGLEWSWPLRLACAWRCPHARVRRGDIWDEDWSGFDMVYMFQRPESMQPAADKARRELRPGSWLVSLEFEAPSLKPLAVLHNIPGKPVWVYRMS
jgi:hypothetical protein